MHGFTGGGRRQASSPKRRRIVALARVSRCAVRAHVPMIGGRLAEATFTDVEETDAILVSDGVASPYREADFQEDHDVDNADLALWRMNFGATTGATTTFSPASRQASTAVRIASIRASGMTRVSIG